MPKLAIDVGTVLLLILPGFLAYRFAVLQRADPTHRSVIWQVSEILEHSLYVHLLGIIFAFAIHLAFVVFGSTTHLAELLKFGPQRFLEDYFAEAIWWYVGYAIYIIVASAIIGAYNVPSRISTGMIALLRISPKWRLLNRLPVPGAMYHQEPIWYRTFRAMSENLANQANADSNDSNDDSPVVFIRMKDSGDVYVGQIASYPIVSDTQSEKDFLIERVRYYPGGSFERAMDLAAVDGVGAVLLNSINVESIRVVYHQNVAYHRDVDGYDQPPNPT